MVNKKKIEKLYNKLQSEKHWRRKRAIKKAKKYTEDKIVDALLLILLLEENYKLRLLTIDSLTEIALESKKYRNEIKTALEKTKKNDANSDVQQYAEKKLTEFN